MKLAHSLSNLSHARRLRRDQRWRHWFESLEDRCLLATFTVANTNDAATGSLRQAILDANNAPGADMIEFKIGSGPQTITPLSALPEISGPTLLDGTTQIGFAGQPIIELRGTSAGQFSAGLKLGGTGASTVRGLVINRFSGNGIEVNSNGNVIEGNFIGTNVAGTASQSNGFYGVSVSGASNVIGGLTAAARNVVSGNVIAGIGIAGPGATGNMVRGNFLGPDVSGTTAFGNSGQGVEIRDAPGNEIGGLAAGAGNLISGNGGVGRGIMIQGAGATGNVVRGNVIGLDPTGTMRLGQSIGITIDSATGNSIGGTSANARNVISANGTGIDIRGSATTNVVQGNCIGLDITCTIWDPDGNPANGNEMGNGSGVVVTGGTNNLIGGTAENEGNIISGNSASGISLFMGPAGTGGSNTVWGNLIGTDVTATLARGNGFGVRIQSPNNQIGGAQPGAGNLISGNQTGIEIAGSMASGNVVQGNRIGTDATGAADLGNVANGVLLSGVANNRIGGTLLAERNIISGNNSNGIQITGLGATNNQVLGNFIGLDVTGTVDLGNSADGMDINGAPNNVIGGTAAGARNVISGNNVHGIDISGSSATGNQVLNNLIGTDVTGTVALGNSQQGVRIGSSASNNSIGGSSAAARNIISGNMDSGIQVIGGANGNFVRANFIGTDISGSAALGNANGVSIISAGNNEIGGTSTAEGNLVSGNVSWGLVINNVGATGNTVRGNFIGTDLTGTIDLGNAMDGVLVSNASDNTIGTIGAGNLISGNNRNGVFILGNAARNRVLANHIGTNSSGDGPLMNSMHGVAIQVDFPGAGNNSIGGMAVDSGNTIAFNGADGVFVAQNTSNTRNLIASNSIFANSGLGIDLEPDGITPNDANDSDTGANNLQNFPVMSMAMSGVAGTHVEGSLNSTPNTTFTLQFSSSPQADPLGFGEGQTLLGSSSVTTNSGGDASFTADLPLPMPTGHQIVTATAIDPNGNTSEFSAAITRLLRNVFVVNSAVDPGDGVANAAELTLREAIIAANATANLNEPDLIMFDIPAVDPGHFSYHNDAVAGQVSLDHIMTTSAGDDSLLSDPDPDWPHSWFSIRLAAGLPLPSITDAVRIDGFTQPGAMVNTNSVASLLGLNTVLKIELDGSQGGTGTGLVIDSITPGTVIRGLVIGGFASGSGIRLQIGANSIIEGNFIGTDPSGMIGHGNRDGLRDESGGNLIGGSTPAARNLISGNTGDGIRIDGYRVQGSSVQGNLVGADRTGTKSLGNGGDGVELGNDDNIVGGTGLGQRNILSGNGGEGIFIDGSNNVVQNNFIGIDVTGTRPVPNTMHGIRITSSGNLIGGPDAADGTEDGNVAARNVIAANLQGGISIESTHNTRVQANLIGTDVTGMADLGNGFDPSGGRYAGITIDLSAEENLIGGVETGAGNLIAYNAGDGVAVWSGIDNAILGNRIFSNGGLGIDLYPDNVTPNDVGDADTGANNLQNFPVLSSVQATPTSTTIEGVLNSTASKTFRIEFFASPATDQTGYGEGQRFLGAVEVTTSSDAPFGPTFSTTVGAGEFITATATLVTGGSADPGFGDTSEFSQAIEVPEIGPTFATASGIKYEDMDGDRTRDEGEAGLDGWFIYVDLDGHGTRDDGEPFAITAGGGFYTIVGIPPGRYQIREELQTPWIQTAPEGGSYERLFVSGSARTDLDFGNRLILDFGDAPYGYPTLLVDNGARHVMDSTVHLGNAIDAEFNGQPEVSALGDDLAGVDDEDGVIFSPLFIGAMAEAQVTASIDGFLSAWINFNVAGNVDTDWVDPGEQIFADRPLHAGLNHLNFFVPGGATLGDTFARFRFSSIPLGLSYDGLAVDADGRPVSGEVEDYQVRVQQPVEIHGNKWNDVNANGVWDDGEQALPGWTIFLDTDHDGILDAGEVSTVTDADGAYAFIGLEPGSYFVVEVVQAGWQHTFPGTERVSVDDAGNQANGDSSQAAISADGRYVAFASRAALVPDDDNGFQDIYVHDRQTGTIERVSVDGEGNQGDLDSEHPSISGDGQFVAFASWATNLVENDTNGQEDVFVFDRHAGSIQRVSVNSAGNQANSHSQWPSISADGRFVAFESFATDLVDDDTNFVRDVFVVDRGSGSSERVSVNNAGDEADDQSSMPSISGDGRFVAFLSEAGNLVDGDANLFADILVFDRQTRTLEVAGVDSMSAFAPSISADGRFVAFDSVADLIADDSNGREDIYVFDRQAGALELVSVDNAGNQADDVSQHPSISADGRFVTFQSFANLAGEDDVLLDIFVFDRQQHSVERVSVDNAGNLADGWSFAPSISADGWFIAFHSEARNLTDEDTNFFDEDVFVRARLPGHSLTLTGGQVAEGVDFGNFQPTDFGDAPASYGTLVVDNGARHLIGSGLYLGSGVDFEPDGQPTAAADGDDIQGGDDEDGVIFDSPMLVGSVVNVRVAASMVGLLNAWIDFNRDGDWDDAGEQVFSNRSLTRGPNFLSFSVPVTAVPGQTFGRFRLCSQRDLLPDGLASNGEVEDYRLNIELPASMHGTKWNDLNGNGVRDPGEPGLEGWTILLDANGNGQLDEGELSTTTDEDGDYSFVVSPGSYTVAEVNQEDWMQSYPAQTARVSFGWFWGSLNASISNDGRFIAFESYATNLIPDDTNGANPDIFVFDRLTGTTELVSVDSTSRQSDFSSTEPSISGDGRFVAFIAVGDDLVPEDMNEKADIVVFDREERTIERVSLSVAGNEADEHSFKPAISADGRFVAFHSWATNLVPDDTNEHSDIFVFDRQERTIERVSVDSAGHQADSVNVNPSISADGRFVAFESAATNLVPDDNNNSDDIFVFDRQAHAIERVSMASDGTEADWNSTSPSISGDGRWVAFASRARNLVPEDDNNVADIFIHDRQTGTIERVTGDVVGEALQSSDPSISADGRMVAFVADFGDDFDDRVFLFDRVSGGIRQVSVNSAGHQANDDSLSPSISGDGQSVAFESWADNLVPGDGDSDLDVFVHTIPTHLVTLRNGEVITGLDFGNFQPEALNANDWGDAPAPYPTRAIDNGPSHPVVRGFYLGLGVDDETNGQPTQAADGDGADEDGVVFLEGLTVGHLADIQATASGVGDLDAWVDFDADGNWGDENDQVFAGERLHAGVNTLTMRIPNGAHVGPTYARFRFTGDIDFDGPAGAGEVEDYRVFVFSEQFQTDDSAEALGRLEQESLLPPDVRFQNGIPRFVSMRVPFEGDLAGDPVGQALDFLDRYRELYRLDDPYAQLYLKRIITDSLGDRHVFFGQHVNGVPVYGSSLAVHLGRRQSPAGGPPSDLPGLANFVLSSGGNWLASEPMLPPAQLGPIQAEAMAAGHVPGTSVQVIGQSALVYFHPGILSDRAQSSTTETHLAWRVNLQGLRASDGIGTTWTYLVDAHDGEVLLSLDQLRTDAADKDFDIETVNNTTSDTCWNAPFVTDDDEWFDEDGEDGYPGADDDPFLDGQNAFDFIHEAYDYFFENFHRHSYDGDEEQVVVHVHVGNNWRNSEYTWSGWGDCFNFGDGQAVLDVVAHEYTHGVTESTAALTYQDESGALNESYSDVFAAMVDDEDWLIGEDRPTGYWRNMADPPDKNDPDHMLAALSGDRVGLRVPPDPTGDNGWVHTNSSIPNKVAYLIGEGGIHPGSGIPVVGIGREKTEQLYYAVLTNRLGENSQFIDARDETVEQAQAFVDAGGGGDPNGDLIGFTARDVCSVINAFAAVGLDPSAADVDCDGTADNADPDDDGDHVPDVADNPDDADNCVSIRNPRQEDLDGDGVGDVCDSDRDGDAVSDAQDNCPTVVNPGQGDADNDGTGNACEDNDVDELGNPQPDGVFDPVDNCPSSFNPGQADNDADGAGNACDPDDDDDGVLDDGDGDGIDGNRPCTGGDRTDCDDNAPFVENPGQHDADNDGVGDSDIHGDPIDNCRGVANSDQADSDRDGAGDLCDSDIDGDNRRNEEDDCPLVFDPEQIDRDHNGIGLACDEAEAFMLSGEGGGLLEGVLRFESPLVPAQTAIFPCLVDCPDWIRENFQSEIDVSLPFAMAARIVDDRGFVVRKAAPATATTLRFLVAADYHSRLSALAPPGTADLLLDAASSGNAAGELPVETAHFAAGDAYRGRRYFLEILPTDEIEPGQLYLFQIRVLSGLRDIMPPTLPELADLVVEAPSPTGAVVTYPLPVATDDTDPDPTVVCTPPSGAVFPMGTITVSCTAADDEGNTSARDFVVTVQDTIGPTVQDLRLVVTSNRITALILTFSEQIDPATAVNPAHFRLVDLGQDTRPGTKDDRPVTIVPPAYDASLHTITVRPAKPLNFGRFYQVTVNGATGVTDLAGNYLNGNRTAGQDFVSGFARGTDLSYVDRTNDRVSVALSRGGVLELFRNADGEGRELRVLNPTKRSRLNGSVWPLSTGSDDRTTLDAIIGTSGIKNNLPLCSATVSTRCFQVGTISAKVVDSLFDSDEFTDLIRHHRRIANRRF